jgi:hypothetical protein
VLSRAGTAAATIALLIASPLAARADRAGKPVPTPTPSRAPVAATADELFEQGRALLERKQYAEACARFEQSMQAEDALGTRLNLAVCLQEWGRLQSAFLAFEDTRKRALSVAQGAFAKAAADRVSAFKAQIPVLVVRPADDLPGMVITIRREGYPDQVVAPAQAVPLDPSGASTGAAAPTVEVTAPDRQPYTSKPIDIVVGQRSVVDVPALAPLGEPSPPPDEAPPAPARGWTGAQKLGVGLAAGGVASLGASLALNLVWRSSAQASSCDDDCIADANARMRFIGTPLFAGGLALVGVGAYLYFARGRSETPRLVPAAAVSARGDGASVAVVGTF